MPYSEELDMPYSTKDDTVTVDGTAYAVERDHDCGPREMFTIEAFPEIRAYVSYDEHIDGCDNPRTSHDCNLGTMYVSYRGYDLGDEGADLPDDGVFEIDCDICDMTGWVPAGSEHAFDRNAPGDEAGDVACGPCGGNGTRPVDPATYFQVEHGARVVVPLFVYEHSGITIRGGSPVACRPLDRADVRSSNRFVGDGAGWDTSFVGFLVDDPAKLKLCGCEDFDTDKIIEALNGEIAEYAAYLEGDVTYFDVRDPETDYAEGCGGFVGCRDECVSECFGAIESAIAQRLKENAEASYWADRGVETVAA